MTLSTSMARRLALALALSLAATGASAGKTVQELLAEGDSMVRLGYPKRAIKPYERALKQTDQPFAPLMGLARAHAELERFDDARELVERALAAAATGDETAAALNYRGLLLVKESRRVDVGSLRSDTLAERRELLLRAIDVYREALAATETPPAAIYANLAEAHSRMVHTQAAREALERFLDLEPGGRPLVAGLLAHVGCLDEAGIGGDPERDRGTPLNGEVEPPRRIRGSPPEVPPGMTGVRGVAVLEAVIDKEGVPHCARTIFNDGLPAEFVALTLRTITGWRFEPGRVDGEPVGVVYNITVDVR